MPSSSLSSCKDPSTSPVKCAWVDSQPCASPVDFHPLNRLLGELHHHIVQWMHGKLLEGEILAVLVQWSTRSCRDFDPSDQTSDARSS